VSVLDDASDAVRARGEQYGEPARNFSRISALWNVFLFDRLETPITPAEVGILCALIKVARLQEDIGHYDSWVDAAGYFDAGWRAK
jgi:hypothetical protein